MKCSLASIAVLLLLGCSSMQAPTADVETAINQLNAQLADAVRSGDPAAVAGFYAEDAVMMPPNMPAARGRDAIRQMWAGILGSGKVYLKLTTDKVLHAGNLATEVGSFDFTITPSGGAPQHDVGKYAVTWRNVNGQWRIVVDIFNSNLPANAPH